MKVITKNIDDIIADPTGCPLTLSIIPNYMGINLCSVDSISWQKQDDGQLTNLSIYFKPDNTVKEK